MSIQNGLTNILNTIESVRRMVITPTLQAEEVQQCNTNGAVIHFMCDIHKCLNAQNFGCFHG